MSSVSQICFILLFILASSALHEEMRENWIIKLSEKLSLLFDLLNRKYERAKGKYIFLFFILYNYFNNPFSKKSIFDNVC